MEYVDNAVEDNVFMNDKNAVFSGVFLIADPRPNFSLLGYKNIVFISVFSRSLFFQLVWVTLIFSKTFKIKLEKKFKKLD